MYLKCKSNVKVHDAEEVAKVFYDVLKVEHKIDQNKEHFWVMGLNTKSRVLYLELISLGTLTEGLVHPREVFRSAIFKGVCSLIICHNHPSGESIPSESDKKVTERLVIGGDILGIEILDHIILGKNDTFSFKKEGILPVLDDEVIL
ncbi:DNA repair protein RadC [Candidatus Atribacteria bacterium 1244-E10-H5-B2]|nr:MAG: DNA repair protein RadC [Candidatus Atribacteria bacterium 1244-E10-H5-B2]